jgi:hypothetical protein
MIKIISASTKFLYELMCVLAVCHECAVNPLVVATLAVSRIRSFAALLLPETSGRIIELRDISC